MPALLAVGPVGFDEAEFTAKAAVHGMVVRSLDGVPIDPLSFGFWLGGKASQEARIGGDGPRTTTFTTDPGIEGPARGLLAIDFGTEVTAVGFGFALDVDSSLGDRAMVRAYRPGGILVARVTVAALDDGLFSSNRVELASHEAFTRIEVLFQTTARRFVFDNLFYQQWSGPAPSDENVLRTRGSHPAAAVDSSGRRVVAWVEEGNVRAQLVGRNARPLTEVLAVSTTPVASLEVAVSFDPSGGFVVCWVGAAVGAKAVASDTGVLARFYAANGAPRGEPVQVSAERAVSVTVAHGRDGEPVLFWERGGIVRGRILRADGKPRTAIFTLGRPGATQRAPAVAASSSGSFVVAWHEPEAGADGAAEPATPAIYVRFYAAGSAVTGAIRVNDDSSGLSSAPAVAVDERGDAIVVWQQEKNGDLDIFARRVSRQGALLGAALRVNSLSLGHQRSPSVDANRSGDFTVAWESSPWPVNAPASDADRPMVMVRTFHRLGQPMETDVAVAESGPGEWVGGPSLTVDDDSRVAVVFERRGPGGEELGIFTRLFETELASFGCVEGPRRLCLQGGRFQLEVGWTDFAGAVGSGKARRLSDDTGSFWFFSAANLELIIKILDGRALNGHWWVFYGALSNVGYTITVSDLFTGRSRTYVNPMGRFASVGDILALPDAAATDGAASRVVTGVSALAGDRPSALGSGTPGQRLSGPRAVHLEAFPVVSPALSRGALSRGALSRGALSRGVLSRGVLSRGVLSRGVLSEEADDSPWPALGSFSPSPEVLAGCLETPTVLCLQDSRFQIEMHWADSRGNSGVGRGVGLTADSGYFWFFEPDNVEVVVKILDGRHINGYFWVFYGALSNVEYELSVLDTATGSYRVYRNELGNFASVGDTTAMPP